MATLGDLAKLVRSKNAGPFWLTIDIMFDDAEAYRRARDAALPADGGLVRATEPGSTRGAVPGRFGHLRE